MKKTRTQYDLEYKRRIVAEYLSGTTSAQALGERTSKPSSYWCGQAGVRNYRSGSGGVLPPPEDVAGTTRAGRCRVTRGHRAGAERVPRAGYRTVQGYLRRVGIEVGERCLRRVMQQFSLHAEVKRAFVHTTVQAHA